MMDIQTEDLVKKIAQVLYDMKGRNIIAINVKGISSLTDYMVIAEGNVDRHVNAMADELTSELKKLGVSPVHVEGKEDAEWIVVDYFQVMVHIQIPDVREKYSLEHLWKEGSLIELQMDSNVEQNR